MKGIEVITALKDFITDNDVIVSSNGNISREAFHTLPRPQVYLRGSMGLPVPVGLGLAIARPDKRIIVITGDGNFLMGLGSFVTSAFYKLKNLKILILDNAQYFTTGGQQTVSSAIDYSKFLESFNIGYTQSKKATPKQIKSDLDEFLNSKTFGVLHLGIQASKENLENIPWHPEEITEKIISRFTKQDYRLSKRKPLSRNH
jgi:thiamine pyrophosphate-dependent acetolactate synthase large subunit-like protein